MGVSLQHHRLRYQLEDAFTISRMTRTKVDALIIEISGNGVNGYGEATDNPYYNSQIEGLVKEFENHQSKIEINGDLEPVDFYDQYIDPLPIHSFLKCALDEAYWDWYGKSNGHSTQKLLPWDWDQSNIPTSSYTIGLDSAEKMKEKILSQEWPLYKIKINNEQPAKLIKELRGVTASPFYLDANGSLSETELKKLLENAAELNIQLIEQAFKVGEEDRIKYFDPTVPMAGDESFITAEDLERCRPYFDICNFKLMKSGGMSPVLKQVTKAKALGYQIMMGCMTESSIGISAIAAFLPSLNYVDMDGALLLKNDLSENIIFKEGIYQRTKLNGNGISVNLQTLQDLKYED